MPDNFVIKSLVRKGANHAVYCEDSSHFSIKDNIVVMAVYDGCSTGKRSHFASELLCKCTCLAELFPKIFKEMHNTHDILDYLIMKIFNYLKCVSDYLRLDTIDCLSTMVIAVVDTSNNKTSVAFCGDGVVYVNGDVIRNQQNNEPDYMAYHKDMPHLLFLGSHHIKYHEFENVKDISVCTDGIDSYNELNDNKIHECLVNSKRFIDNDVMLERLYNILKVQHPELYHFDDLSIVRLIFKDEETI